MRKPIRIDFTNHAIVLTREFQKLASDVRSDEYAILQRVRKDYPDFSVGTRAIKKNPSKTTYKNFTYEFMKEYIESHDDKKHTILKEFNEMRFISKCHKRTYAYATIKAWFLDKYPDVKKFGVEEAMKRAEEARRNIEAKTAEVETTEAERTEEKAVA